MKRDSGGGRRPAGDQPETGSVFPVLFAVRWGAWSIALIRIALGDLPADETRYEPVLLGLTFCQTLAAMAYVPLFRPHIRRLVGDRAGPRDDLIALGLVDIV